MSHTTAEDQGLTLHEWRVGGSRFRALPEHGARLMDWVVEAPGTPPRPVIHWPTDFDPGLVAKVRGGNPILFPFNARSFDRGEIGFWRSPDGQRRPMGMHGFMRQATCVLETADDSGFTARLVPTPEDHESYPFDYEFRVSYVFFGNRLEVHLRLKNLGAEPLPWSAGHHFYYHLPWKPGTDRADYTIALDAARAFRHADDGSLSPETSFDRITAFDAPELVDRIHCGWQTPGARFGLRDGSETVTACVLASPAPLEQAAIVTWTEKADSPFYCVEPWMGPPNAPEHGQGLAWVPPGEEQAFSVEIRLDDGE